MILYETTKRKLALSLIRKRYRLTHGIIPIYEYWVNRRIVQQIDQFLDL